VAINCEREVFAHNTSRLARPGWSTTRRCARYILRRLMIDRMTIAAVARELGLSLRAHTLATEDTGAARIVKVTRHAIRSWRRLAQLDDPCYIDLASVGSACDT
jgi:hypothetical protein